MADLLKYTLDENFQRVKEGIENQLDYINIQQSVKLDDEGVGTFIDPLIPMGEARYIYHRSSILRKVVEIEAQDVILNKYTLEGVGEDSSRFDAFWNESNKYQLYLAGIEYFTYGFGALEVVFNGNRADKLVQIPAYSVRILRETYNINDEEVVFYYLIQTVNSVRNKFRLTHKDYSILDDLGIDDASNGYALWIGGGADSDWYALPHWIHAKNNLLTLIEIDELNNEKIYNGNIPSGVMLFTGPRQLTKNGEDPIEKKLSEELKSSGAGTVFSYIATPTNDAKIDVDYTALEDNNYEYLEALKEDALQSLLNACNIPKVRLMIDDTKESLNSQKSDTIYEIYNVGIACNQSFFKQILNGFCKNYLGVHSEIVIALPEFVEKTQSRAEIIMQLFDKGLVTLGQAVDLLSDILPELNLDSTIDIDANKDNRYYNGKLLGSMDDMSSDDKAYERAMNQLNSHMGDFE